MKTVKMLRINSERADRLKEKSVELTIKKRELIKESELINWLIDQYLDDMDVNKEGIYLKSER